MSIPVYPASLPCVLRENYGFEPVNNILRTPMQSGRARQRLEFRNVPSLVRLRWVMTAVQARIFEAWASQIVGAEWCDIPLLSPMGPENITVRFTESPKGGELTGKYLWRYEAICEVRDRPMLDPGWVEILPEYLAESDIFDYAMNQQWPLNQWQIYAEAFDTAINEDWPQP